MLPLFRSKPVFSAFLFIVVGLTIAGGGAWLLFIDGTSFYLFIGSGILLTGIMLLNTTSIALWFYGAVLTGAVALAVHEVGFNGEELESQLLAPAILGFYLLLPLALRQFWPRPEARRLEPALQVRLAMLAPALGVVSAVAAGVLSLFNPADVPDPAANGHRIANARIVFSQKSPLGSPRSADMLSSISPRFYWRDERTDYP